MPAFSVARAIIVLALVAALQSCDSFDSTVCKAPTGIHIVKTLLLGNEGAKNLDRAIEITDVRALGTSPQITTCEAHFALASKMVQLLRNKVPQFSKAVELAAEQAHMTPADVHNGILSGQVRYAVENVPNDNGSITTKVTLSNFNLARAQALNNFLALAQMLNSATTFHAPAILTWNAKADGNPKLYRNGTLEITLSTQPDATVGLPDPVIRIEGGGQSTVYAGQPGFDAAAARVLVGNLDPTTKTDQVIFLTYSGGAHCCTTVDVFELVDGHWKRLALGDWDGDAIDGFPSDVDGDHVPDIVLADQSFYYQFASYAESYGPSLIFDIDAGVVKDVTTDPRFAPYFRQQMTTFQAACLLHNNGGCAAFVAAASRLGYFSYAWQYMLDNYNQDTSWLLPKLCRVPRINAACPSGEEYDAPNYPLALVGFLSEHGYPVPQALMPQAQFAPTFDCRRVRSQVLLLICSTPELSMLDQDLAASYRAARDATPSSDEVRSTQLAWIRLRNNSEATVELLARLYRERIAALKQMAQSNSLNTQDQ